MSYGITQCYLPPNSGDFPAFTPAEAGTRFDDPGRMQGWVDMSFTVVFEICVQLTCLNLTEIIFGKQILSLEVDFFWQTFT